MNMNPAISKLVEYLEELEAIDEFESIEEKAGHIGLLNQIEIAIGQIQLCEEHGISSGSLVSVLPEPETPNFTYLVVHDNESTNPENWEDVLFNGRQIWLSSGDLVIRK